MNVDTLSDIYLIWIHLKIWKNKIEINRKIKNKISKIAIFAKSKSCYNCKNIWQIF